MRGPFGAWINGRPLAYRRIGRGKPIVLCNRFRGTLDSWDPAFIDGLADGGFDVIWFDYSGLGLSTGDRTYDPALADLFVAHGGGWFDQLSELDLERKAG